MNFEIAISNVLLSKSILEDQIDVYSLSLRGFLWLWLVAVKLNETYE